MNGDKISMCMSKKSSLAIPLGKQINIKSKNIEYQNIFNIDGEVKSFKNIKKSKALLGKIVIMF